MNIARKIKPSLLQPLEPCRGRSFRSDSDEIASGGSLAVLTDCDIGITHQTRVAAI